MSVSISICRKQGCESGSLSKAKGSRKQSSSANGLALQAPPPSEIFVAEKKYIFPYVPAFSPPPPPPSGR